MDVRVSRPHVPQIQVPPPRISYWLDTQVYFRVTETWHNVSLWRLHIVCEVSRGTDSPTSLGGIRNEPMKGWETRKGRGMKRTKRSSWKSYLVNVLLNSKSLTKRPWTILFSRIFTWIKPVVVFFISDPHPNPVNVL